MEFSQTGMAAVEEEAATWGQERARHLLQTKLLSWVRSLKWPFELPDAEGGEPFRLRRWRQLQVVTLVGPIEITVPSYEKQGRRSLRVVEAMLGLRHSVSPMVQKLCGSIGVELPFQPAERELKDLARIQVSRSTINRVCLELGQEAQQVQKEPHLPANFGDVTKIVVEMDGGRVNTDQGWKEPRLARIEAINAQGLKAVFVLTAIVGSEEFWATLTAFLKALGLDACRQMAFIGDGAKWILGEAAERFPQALRILDFYHAAQHIHAAADAIWGEGTVQAEAWARRCRRWLRKGRIDALLAAWKCAAGPLRARGTAARDAIDGLIEYFGSRIDQVRYPRFRRRKFPIGSGRIEAAVKQVLNLRLKRNGAWWSVPNAEAILALRAAKLYGTLDDAWRRRVSKRCSEIPPQLRDFAVSVPHPSLAAA